jgi:hypothetical protein
MSFRYHLTLQTPPPTRSSNCPFSLRPDVVELCQRMVQSCRRVPAATDPPRFAFTPLTLALFSDECVFQAAISMREVPFNQCLPSPNSHCCSLPLHLRLLSTTGAPYPSTSVIQHNLVSFTSRVLSHHFLNQTIANIHSPCPGP